MHLESSTSTKTHLTLVMRDWSNEAVYVTILEWEEIDKALEESAYNTGSQTRVITRKWKQSYFRFEWTRVEGFFIQPTWMRMPLTEVDFIDTAKAIVHYPQN